MGRQEKLAAKVLGSVTLDEGERAEVATIAEVGTLRRQGWAPAALIGMVFGMMTIMSRKRWALILTDRRLIAVDPSADWSVIGFWARSDLRRGDVKQRMYLWFDLAETDGEHLVQLNFPMPARVNGRQIADAISPLIT